MLFEVDTLLLVGAGIITIVALAFAVRPYVIRRPRQDNEGQTIP